MTMTTAHALVVLPAAAHPRIIGQAEWRWWSRGRICRSEERLERLDKLLRCLGRPRCPGGAALRYRGDSGKWPTGWVAAADPVYFQTRLRDVVLRELRAGEVAAADLEPIFATLQQQLGDADGFRLERFGTNGYLVCDDAFDTPGASAAALDGVVPDRHSPGGVSARAWHKLQGELQMLLHAHPVNQRREAAGLLPISTLWIWGGGERPPQVEAALPVLYGSDPIFAGYWRSCSAAARPWGGDFRHCLETSARQFVVVVPAESRDNVRQVLHGHIGQLRKLLQRGELSRVTMLFRDGLTIDLRRRDLVKFWRRMSPLLNERGADE